MNTNYPLEKMYRKNIIDCLKILEWKSNFGKSAVKKRHGKIFCDNLNTSFLCKLLYVVKV